MGADVKLVSVSTNCLARDDKGVSGRQLHLEETKSMKTSMKNSMVEMMMTMKMMITRVRMVTIVKFRIVLRKNQSFTFQLLLRAENFMN